MTKRSVSVLFISLFFSSQLFAQDINIIAGSQSDKTALTNPDDPDTEIIINEKELNNRTDLLRIFERENRSFSAPVALSKALIQMMPQDETGLSAEARYWADWKRDPATIIDPGATFRDTMIVNPLFERRVLKGGVLPKDTKEWVL